MKKIDLRIADFFAGAGGLGTGFEQYFKVEFACDYNEDAVATYQFNHPETQVKNGDIRNYDFGKKDFDFITGAIGGPSCQDWSGANQQRDIESDRANSIHEMLRVAKEVNPDFILVENVQGVDPRVKTALEKEFRKLGYKVQSNNIECGNYGSVQIAQRWILIASKHRFIFPEPVNNKRKASEILLDDLSNVDKSLMVTPRPETIERMKKLEYREGVVWYRLKGRPRANYCLVHPDYQIGKLLDYTSARYVPVHDRTRYLTFEELHAAQGFPEGYEFQYKKRKGKKSRKTTFAEMLANAVPVETASIFAREIYNSIIDSMSTLDYYFSR